MKSKSHLHAIKVLIALVLAFCVTWPAFAHDGPRQCESIFASQGRLHIDASQVETSSEILTPHYEAAIERVKRLVEGAGLSFPTEEIHLTIHSLVMPSGERVPLSEVAAIQDRRDGLFITVPYRWMVERSIRGTIEQLELTPEVTLALFWHELGHAVFREAAERSGSIQLSRFYRRRRELQEMIFSLLREIEHARGQGMPEEQLLVNYSTRLKETVSMVKREKRAMEQTPLGQIIRGMDEFFADVVSVMTANDPRAMAEALVGPDGTLLWPAFRPRDFLDPSNRLDNWDSRQTDVWSLLGPSRYHLGSNYHRVTAGTAAFSPHLLQAVFRAIEETASSLSDNDGIGPRSLNRRLMNAIDRHAQGRD